MFEVSLGFCHVTVTDPLFAESGVTFTLCGACGATGAGVDVVLGGVEGFVVDGGALVGVGVLLLLLLVGGPGTDTLSLGGPAGPVGTTGRVVGGPFGGAVGGAVGRFAVLVSVTGGAEVSWFCDVGCVVGCCVGIGSASVVEGLAVGIVLPFFVMECGTPSVETETAVPLDGSLKYTMPSTISDWNEPPRARTGIGFSKRFLAPS